MEVIILPDTNKIGAIGADAIAALLHRKPAAVLGLVGSVVALYSE